MACPEVEEIPVLEWAFVESLAWAKGLIDLLLDTGVLRGRKGQAMSEGISCMS